MIYEIKNHNTVKRNICICRCYLNNRNSTVFSTIKYVNHKYRIFHISIPNYNYTSIANLFLGYLIHFHWLRVLYCLYCTKAIKTQNFPITQLVGLHMGLILIIWYLCLVNGKTHSPNRCLQLRSDDVALEMRSKWALIIHNWSDVMKVWEVFLFVYMHLNRIIM